MAEEPTRRLTCQKTGGHCQLYWAGHNTHWIHAKHIGRTPWGWRDAAVTGIDGRWLTVDYVLDSGTLRLWHHTRRCALSFRWAALSGCTSSTTCSEVPSAG